VTVTTGGATVTYLYGPDGERLKKQAPAGTTLYIETAERDPAGAWTTWPAPEVKRAGSVLNWLHRDHLTSVRRVTDATGTLTRASVYRPYGVQVETVLAPLSPPEPKGWIGERTDPETGLTYLHARYYDASLGRFLSPDWWDVSDPGVGTDRYGYSAGDPVNKADANGHVSTFLESLIYGNDEDREKYYQHELSTMELLLQEARDREDPSLEDFWLDQIASVRAKIGLSQGDLMTQGAIDVGVDVAGTAAAGVVGLGVRSAASAFLRAELPAARQLLGTFAVPPGMKFGTTTFGKYAHLRMTEILRDIYPDVRFTTRVGPGQRGVDVSVPKARVEDVGFAHAEFKPDTASGQRSYLRQLARWGLRPDEVQAITYDALGNVYIGF